MAAAKAAVLVAVLLNMLLGGMSRGASIGMSEFVTHSGLTIVFFVLAGLSAYGATKRYW